jgi:hypothetical protein
MDVPYGRWFLRARVGESEVFGYSDLSNQGSSARVGERIARRNSPIARNPGSARVGESRPKKGTVRPVSPRARGRDGYRFQT